jgi:hypothetical protein
MKALFSVMFWLGFAALATAQHVDDCVTENGDAYQTSVRAMVEPWEDNTRTFANGDVRLAYLDTEEPVNASAFLLILSPPYDVMGAPQCKIITMLGGLGFASVSFGDLTAGYDPAIGLTFEIPVALYNAGTDAYRVQPLSVTLNQATGLVTAAFE